MIELHRKSQFIFKIDCNMVVDFLKLVNAHEKNTLEF